ncbi:TIGR03943 family putative permease subunit [Streptomyces sp. NPDC056160]|uniref:TIGR03943 family putative permease subunit n=1 Tax=Streptomyces sp. NPDC056160 TaxID=3345731 RepID=UPI0035D5D6A3
MKRPLQVALLVLSGLGLLRAALFTDLYLRYVKEGMRPLLIASGVLLLLLGAAEAWPVKPDAEHGDTDRGDTDRGDADHRDADRGDADRGDAEHGDESPTDHTGQAGPGDRADAGPHTGHGHSHAAVPRVAWLLFLPALSLLCYAPPALGAYTAAREAPKAVDRQSRFDPLPVTSPLPLTLSDFTRRVQQDREQAVRGRTVVLTGFVTPGKGRDTWDLTRIILSCCAADAQSVKVRIHGAPSLPPDTWVSVTGTWHPGGTLGTASAPVALDARTVRRISRPANAYRDDLPLVPPR